MNKQLFAANTTNATLSAALTANATTVQLSPSDAALFPTIVAGSGDYFLLTLGGGQDVRKITANNKATGALTSSGTVEGTASAWAAGASAINAITAGTLSSLAVSSSIEQFAGMPLTVYSNSYDAADTVNTPGTRTVVQFAAKHRMALTNNAVSGTTMQDFVAKAVGTVSPIPVTYNGLIWIGNGINDAARSTPDPTSAAPQAGYKACLETLIYRACAATVIAETDASFVYSGTGWVANPQNYFSNGNLKKTSVQGDSVTITTPVGTDFVLLTYGVYNVTSGDATITLDGQPFTVVSNPQAGTSPNSGAITAPYAIAFTGLANTAHTIVVTKTDATTNFIYVDDLFVLKANPPLILAEKTCQIQAAGYTTEGGKGSDATVATYNTLFDTTIAKVRAAYPKVRIAVADPQLLGWDKTTMIGSDGLHPNDFGEYFRRIVAESAVKSAVDSLGWVAGLNKM